MYDDEGREPYTIGRGRWMNPLPAYRRYTPCDDSMHNLTKEEKAYVLKLRDGEYVDEENVLSREERDAIDVLRDPSNGELPPNGFIRFKNGDVYQGDFRIVECEKEEHFPKHYMEGTGTMWMADGRVYEGEWKDDMKDGKGRFERPVGGEYFGDFSADKMNGNGVYKLPDGTLYRGEFKHDMMHGYGEMFYLGKIHDSFHPLDHYLIVVY